MEAAQETTEQIHPLIAYGRARGNGTTNIRDAAHEAFHALTVGAKKNWDREVIHKKLTKRFRRAELWVHEMEARAVEQLVCAELGVKCGPLSEWVGVSIMEAIKNRLPYADFEVSMKIAETFLARKGTKAMAERIAKLGEP